ncbi:hypothetical protein E2C01_045324 [Portunus trituberculatus]|uniref:Uncharacterized protein n=1 Tax=Portunus trituberculatus TaxID=210409 RepID=A0A5B7G2W1_PORTR|nr:hypothetical protein [Portunus trituberculatus]
MVGNVLVRHLTQAGRLPHWLLVLLDEDCSHACHTHHRERRGVSASVVYSWWSEFLQSLGFPLRVVVPVHQDSPNACQCEVLINQ